MDNDNKAFLLGILAGVCIGMMIFLLLIVIISPMFLSQETGNEICRWITRNDEAIADHENGNLICETPSFGGTQNIIIRRNDE